MRFELHHPSKQSIPLIEFSFGNEKVYCTTSKTRVVWKGNTYLPEPGIDITVQDQGGDMDQDTMKIVLPRSRSEVNPQVKAIADALASSRSCPPVRVVVAELIRSSPLDERINYLGSGICTRSRRNPSGRSGVVELEVISELFEGLDSISLGRRCDPECDYPVFGGTGCYLDATKDFAPADYATSFKKIRNLWVTVVFSNPKNPREAYVNVDTSKHPGGTQALILNQPRDWWLRSRLEFNGLSIPVQEWVWLETTGSTNILILNRIPPSNWEAASVHLMLDCPRTKQGCTDRNNISRFGAIGYGIPAYNPALDDVG